MLAGGGYIRKRFSRIFGIFLLFFSIHAKGADSAAHPIGLSVSLGIPDLLNFQAQYLKLKWLRFGYGLGTQPVKQIIKKFAKIDMNKFVYSVNEDYEVYPVVDLGVRAFNSFIRVFPGTESFYLETKYTIWKINANVDALLRNKATQISIDVGSVGFQIMQPMLGGGVGYQAIWDSGFFLDMGLGAQYLFKPNATYWIGGLLGSGLSSSVIAPEIHEQIKAGQNTINKQIDDAVRKMRETITVIPSFYFTLGWTFG